MHRGQFLGGFSETFRIGYFFGGTAGPLVQVSIINIYVNTIWLQYTSQAFFTTRVAKCFNKPYLAILCWTLTFLRFLSSMWLASVSINSGPLSQFQARWQWLLTAGLILEACIDLLIAASLCLFLVKSRHHSVHKRCVAIWWHAGNQVIHCLQRTIRLLDKLIAMTIRDSSYCCHLHKILMLLLCRNWSHYLRLVDYHSCLRE